MTKTQRVSGRGTSVREADVEEANWAGESFREVQKERLRKAGENLTMHLGRGVRTVKSENLPSLKERPSSKGMTRTTNRGTSSRKSRDIRKQSATA